MSELRELAKPLAGTRYELSYSEHPTATQHRYVFQHIVVLSEKEARAEITLRIAELMRTGELKLPAEWEKVEEVRVLDADGWGRSMKHWPERKWDELLTREEFNVRASHSTTEHKIR